MYARRDSLPAEWQAAVDDTLKERAAIAAPWLEQARRSLELDLRNALENDTFELHYQPLVELKTRRILGCEALLRWPHPERGMISPGEFIPIAEEMGLIVEIGKRVLRKACQECRNWPGDIRVAVNLSPTQFSRSNVPNLVRDMLAETGLAANRL